MYGVCLAVGNTIKSHNRKVPTDTVQYFCVVLLIKGLHLFALKDEIFTFKHSKTAN